MEYIAITLAFIVGYLLGKRTYQLSPDTRKQMWSNIKETITPNPKTKILSPTQQRKQKEIIDEFGLDL